MAVDVAGREDGIELRAAPEQLLDGLAAGLLARFGIDLEALVGFESRGAQGPAIAAPAVVEFRKPGSAVPMKAIVRRPL